MNKLRSLPEVLRTDVWVYSDHHGHRGFRVPELDDSTIDPKLMEPWDTGSDLHGARYWLVRYPFSDGFTRLAVLWIPPTPEDDEDPVDIYGPQWE